MSVVYWAPYGEEQNYGSLQLLYNEPDALIPLVIKNRNRDNQHNNFSNCHAFLNSAKNTFVLRSPYSVDVEINNEFGVVSLNPKTAHNTQFVVPKDPSLNNSKTFALYANWIFWSDKPLVISSSPAYYHKPVVDGFYVGGAFDINAWFRPLEAAIQLNENVNTVQIERNQPIAYIQFQNPSPIQFQRFYLNNELRQLSRACLNYKRHEKTPSLTNLYSLFKSNGLDKAISREIQKNLI